MSNASTLVRSLLVYGVCLPLAILLGYMLADPDSLTTLGTVGIILFLLAVPLLLRWHHAWLIAVWNTSMTFMFLPGRPPAWLLITGISFLVSMGQYILNRRMKFLYVPSVIRPLIFLAVVVFVTAKLTGGFGMRAFGGDSYGGKRYYYIFAAILGYFALTSQQIPPRRRNFYVSMYFLGLSTYVIGSLSVLNTSLVYPLFLLFPPEANNALENPTGNVQMVRLAGFAVAGSAIVYTLLARYGVQEVFRLRRPWKLVLFAFCIVLSLFGGFRSNLAQMALVFSLVFYFEGMLRSRLTPVLIIGTICIFTVIAPFAEHLPLSVQRTLSFLPIPIDPVARMDAEGSSEWRVKMWKHVLPQIPQYLIIGKGYSINAADLNSLTGSSGEGVGLNGSELAGDYHSGPLSVIIPFGLFGSIAFLWFLYSGYRVMQRNYRDGDPECRRLNRFLFAFFITKVLGFFLIFGGFYGDLASFTGLIAISVSLNGGVAKPPVGAPPPRNTARRFLPPKKPLAAGNPS
jgi:hypothetical protein